MIKMKDSYQFQDQNKICKKGYILYKKRMNNHKGLLFIFEKILRFKLIKFIE